MFWDLNGVGVVKGNQCFIGPVLTPFDPPTCVINSKKKMGAIVINCTKEW